MKKILSEFKYTIILVSMNVLLFSLFATLSQFDNKIPLYFSAWKYETGLFAPYQLLSYQFIHADLNHLVMNLFILIPTSFYLETSLKSRRLIYYFLIAGIIGGCFHLMLHDQSLPLVGASGSIWGLSVLLGLLSKSNFFKLLLLCCLGYEIYKCFSSTNDYIAHFCHIGGALAGLLIYFFDRKYLSKINKVDV